MTPQPKEPTPETLRSAELLELCERATYEPWTAELMGSEGWTVRATVHTTHRTWMRALATNLSEADAKLIVAARTAIPRLLEVERAAKRLVALDPPLVEGVQFTCLYCGALWMGKGGATDCEQWVNLMEHKPECEWDALRRLVEGATK